MGTSCVTWEGTHTVIAHRGASARRGFRTSLRHRGRPIGEKQNGGPIARPATMRAWSQLRSPQRPLGLCGCQRRETRESQDRDGVSGALKSDIFATRKVASLRDLHHSAVSEAIRVRSLIGPEHARGIGRESHRVSLRPRDRLGRSAAKRAMKTAVPESTQQTPLESTTTSCGWTSIEPMGSSTLRARTP